LKRPSASSRKRKWPAAGHHGDEGKIIAHRKSTPDERKQRLIQAVQIPASTISDPMPIATRIRDAVRRHQATPSASKIGGRTSHARTGLAPRSSPVNPQGYRHDQRLRERVIGDGSSNVEIDRDAIARYG